MRNKIIQEVLKSSFDEDVLKETANEGSEGAMEEYKLLRGSTESVDANSPRMHEDAASRGHSARIPGTAASSRVRRHTTQQPTR